MSTPLASVCISAEMLRDWLEDRLGEVEAAAVGSHLEHCSPCRTLLETLTQDVELRSLVRSCGPLPDGADGNAGMGALVETLRGLSRRTRPPANASLGFLAPPTCEGDLGTLGTYRVLELIAQGGMGVVLKALDTRLQRPVALKVIRSELVDDPNHLLRFQREGQALAGVKHPNVVEVYAVERPENGPPYLVMEYVPGPTLAECLRQQTRLDPRQAADMAAQVARGLAAAHQAGLTHRDVKPGNIILEEGTGQAKLVDFGLVQLGQEETRLTRTGTVAGTLEYMSPEQVEPAGQMGPASDIYGLGVTLYEALTGEVPFRGTTAVVLRQVLTEDPVPPQQRNELVPRDLETICLKCLRKEPARRYATADELAEDLRRFLGGEPIHARPIPMWEQARKWLKRHPALAALIVVLVFVFPNLLLLLFAWRMSEAEKALFVREGHLRQERDAAERARERGEHEARVQGAQELAALTEYVATTDKPGWTYRSLDSIARVAHLRPPGLDVLKLRATAARCMAGVDLKKEASLLQGVRAFCLLFSPDGKQLAVGDSKGPLGLCKVYIFDVERGKRLADFPLVDLGLDQLNKNGVSALAYSPDGMWLIAGTRAGRVYVWNTVDKRLHGAPWQAHQDEVTGLAFHPEGKLLVSCSHYDKSIRLWDPAAWGKQLGVQTAEHGTDTVVFSPDGSRLACWETHRLQMLSSAGLLAIPPQFDLLASHPGPHKKPCYSPDGRLLAVMSESNTVRVFFINKGGLEPHPAFGKAGHAGEIHHLHFNADGSLLLTSSDDGYVKLWEVATGRLLATLWTGTSGRSYAAFHPSGRYLAVSGGKQTDLYSLGGYHEQTMLALQQRPLLAMRWAPDGKGFACLAVEEAPERNERRGDLTIWSLPDRHLKHQEVLLAPLQGTLWLPGGLAYHPDGQVLVYTDPSTKEFYSWDVVHHRRLGVVPASRVFSLGFGSGGRSLWAAVEADPGKVTMWKWPELQADHWANSASRFLGRNGMVCLAAGNHWVAAGSSDGSTKLFRAAAATDPKLSWSSPKEESTGKSSIVSSVALNPEETLVASGTRSGSVQVARIPSGELLPELRTGQGGLPHDGSVESVSFHPNGSLLATGSKDSKVRLWRLDGSQFHEVIALPFLAPILQVSFHPDGNRLGVLVEGERAIRVWHLDRLRERLRGMNLDW